MIHYVNIDTSSNTGISIADIYAAADDAGLTVSQFEAKVINDAVQAYKRKQQDAQHTGDLHAIPQRG